MRFSAARADRVAGAVVLALCAFYFFITLGVRDLWPTDETRYGAVVWEMRLRGDYLVPRLNGHPYADKPPLYFWITCLIVEVLGGLNDVVLRFPSACFGFLDALFAYAFAKLAWDARSAFLSALVLATSIGFVMASEVVRMDTLLCLFITLSLLLFYRAYRSGATGLRAYWAVYLCMGLAVLSKGPLGLLHPLLAILTFLGWKGGVGSNDFSRSEAGKGSVQRLKPSLQTRLMTFRDIALGRGLLLALGVVALWVVPAALRGGADYAENLLFRQNLGRAIDAWTHREPWYFYLLHGLWFFLPWMAFLPAAVAHAVKRRDDASRLALSWFVANFLLLSLLSGKLAIYLLAITPAAALMVGRYLAELSKPFSPGALVPSVVVFLALLAFGIFAPRLVARAAPEFPRLPAGLIVVTGLPAMAGGVFFLRRHLEGLIGALALFTLLFTGYTGRWLLPAVNRQMSVKPLAEAVRRLQPLAERVGIFRIDNGLLPYYTGSFFTEVNSEAELREYFDPPGRLLVMKAEAYQKYHSLFAGRAQVEGTYYGEWVRYVLLENLRR